MLKFEVIDSNKNKTIFEFPRGKVVLGKGDHCDVILTDSHVSRNHAEILVDDSSARLADLNSTNGTWVNGERLLAEMILSEGDSLRFGEITVRITAVPTIKSVFEEGTDRRQKLEWLQSPQADGFRHHLTLQFRFGNSIRNALNVILYDFTSGFFCLNPQLILPHGLQVGALTQIKVIKNQRMNAALECHQLSAFLLEAL